MALGLLRAITEEMTLSLELRVLAVVRYAIAIFLVFFVINIYIT